MPVQQVLTNQRVPVKIWTDDVNERSKEQLENIAILPFIHHHVAAMPDVHLGIGATIGSVIATHKAIIPAAIGVDLGCGMVAARLSITANDLDEKSLKRCSTKLPVMCRSAAHSILIIAYSLKPPNRLRLA